jgi:hypothetical protein
MMPAPFLLNKLWIQWMIPITELSIRFIGIQHSILFICKPDRFVRVENNDQLPNAKFILRALIVAVEQTFWKGNCLSRSIVLHRLLIKNGISSKLCVGVRSKPKFKAHAWVEHKGRPLNADQKVHQNYQVIENLKLVQKATFS